MAQVEGDRAAMTQGPTLDYHTAHAARRTLRLKRVAIVLASYPLLLSLVVYGAWFNAWATIGHPPRAGADNPGRMGDVVKTAIHVADWFIVLSWPTFLAYGVCVGLLYYQSLVPGSSMRGKLLPLLIAVAPWAAAFLLLNADPGDVVKWAGLTPP
jgi:hypothetical protein